MSSFRKWLLTAALGLALLLPLGFAAQAQAAPGPKAGIQVSLQTGQHGGLQVNFQAGKQGGFHGGFQSGFQGNHYQGGNPFHGDHYQGGNQFHGNHYPEPVQHHSYQVYYRQNCDAPWSCYGTYQNQGGAQTYVHYLQNQGYEAYCN